MTKFMRVVVAVWADADEEPEYNRSSMLIFLLSAAIEKYSHLFRLTAGKQRQLIDNYLDRAFAGDSLADSTS